MTKAIVLAWCLLLCSPAQAGGKNIVVGYGREENCEGELMLVGDTALVVAVETKDPHDNDSERLRVIALRNIRWVRVKGEDYKGLCAGVGILGGGVIGGVLGGIGMDTQGPFSSATIGSLAGAGLGALLGFGIGIGIGYAVSSEEAYIDPHESDFIQTLRSAARYPSSRDLSHLTSQ